MLDHKEHGDGERQDDEDDREEGDEGREARAAPALVVGLAPGHVDVEGRAGTGRGVALRWWVAPGALNVRHADLAGGLAFGAH